MVAVQRTVFQLQPLVRLDPKLVGDFLQFSGQMFQHSVHFQPKFLKALIKFGFNDVLMSLRRRQVDGALDQLDEWA